MSSLITILIRPRETLRALRERPRWLVPFLFLAAAHVMLLVAADAQATRAVLAHLPPSATPADRMEVGAMLSSELPVRSVFHPIRLLTGWSTFAGILYVFIRVLKPPEPIPFVRILALEIHAETVLLLAGFSSLLSPWIIGHPSELASLTPPFSASWLLPASAMFPLVSLLGTVHIFTLWYTVILTVGIRMFCGVTVRKAVVISVSAWILSVLFEIGFLTLLADRLHFHV